MRRLGDDGDAERIDLFQKGVRDLIGQPFLHLQTARVDVDKPGNLAQTDDLAVRDISDVTLPKKRKHVMFAEAVEVDVLHDHHLVIIDSEQRVVERGIDVGRVAARQKAKRLLDSLRRVAQPLAR